MILNLYKHKAKLLGNKAAQPANAANRILTNATIAVPLKCLSSFWRSLAVSLINWKVELKLKWKKYCDFTSTSNDNETANADNANRIIFTTKDTKLHVPVVTLSVKDKQKLSNRLRKGFERSVYWNEYKTKSDNSNATNQFRFFLESNFVGVNRLFVLVHSNEEAASKRFNAKRYYLPKAVIANYNVIINGKNFYDQAIDSDIKRYEEIRKLTTGQSEDYTTGYLLEYD